MDNEEKTWYPDTCYKFKKNGIEVIGTFRHVDCTRVAKVDILRDYMCGKCQVIPTLKSFRKRILRKKAERDASKIRNNYLTVQEREVKLQISQNRVKKKSKVFLLPQANQRLKGRRHCLKVKLAEYSKLYATN